MIKKRKFSKEHRIKIGLAGIGRIPWNKTGKFIECEFCHKSKWKSPSQIKRNSKYCSISCSTSSKTGEKSPNWRGGKKNKCKNCNIEIKSYVATFCRKCYSLTISGNKHYRWKNDRSKLRKYLGSNEKRSPVYKNWRNLVIKRDKYKCRINNNCNGRLEVHHILSWNENPDLRYDINNGITLCHAHHPRKRAEEKRLIPTFKELVSVSKR